MVTLQWGHIKEDKRNLSEFPMQTSIVFLSLLARNMRAISSSWLISSPPAGMASYSLVSSPEKVLLSLELVL